MEILYLENGLVGYFDIVVFIAIVIINFLILKDYIKIRFEKLGRWYSLVFVLLYGFILPFLSMGFEINAVTKDEVIVDSFTLLYTFFRFPMYWLIGLLNHLLYKLLNRR